MWKILGIFLCIAAVTASPLIQVPIRGSRIAGGLAAQRNQFPYQVVLFLNQANSQTICGGSILSSTFCLSAAHCFSGLVSGDVLAGVLNVMEDTPLYESEFKPSNVIVHAGYNMNTQANDIAMIKVTRPFAFSASISAITLPTRAMATNSFVGASATVSGWGLTEKITSDISPVLRFVTLPVISNGDCAKIYGSIIVSSNICTSGANARSSCQGDSGGPKTVMINNRPVQIGIVSFGAERGCTYGYPAVFTRVDSYLTWIASNSNIVVS